MKTPTTDLSQSSGVTSTTNFSKIKSLAPMTIPSIAHIETEKKQSSVKSGDFGSCWTRRDVFLDMLDQRGIPFQELLESSAFFRLNPHLVPTMLKILNPCYDQEGLFHHRNSYFSNQSLAKKDQMIGSVRVKSCSAITIKRHKSSLQAAGQITLIERHSFKKRAPTFLNTDTVNLLDDHRTTMCIPSDFYRHFSSCVEWHKIMRQCIELFSIEISALISYEHFEQISVDDLNTNKLHDPYGDPRVTTTIFSLSKDKGTYEGSPFLRAKKKKNGELRKPRVSRLLVTPARQKTLGSSARQSSLGSSSGKLGIAGSSVLAFEGKNEAKPGLRCGVDPGISDRSANKRSETPSVGRIGVGPTQTTAKQDKVSEGPLKTSIQKQKKPRVISKQETKPLKFVEMPDIRDHVTKKALDWANSLKITESGAVVRLRMFGKSQLSALESGRTHARDAVTPDILDYWLGKINPVQLLYVITEAREYKKQNRVYSAVKFLEYRICATIENITAYEQRKNFNQAETSGTVDLTQQNIKALVSLASSLNQEFGKGTAVLLGDVFYYFGNSKTLDLGAPDCLDLVDLLIKPKLTSLRN